jgi:hypothetical protein
VEEGNRIPSVQDQLTTQQQQHNNNSTTTKVAAMKDFGRKHCKGSRTLVIDEDTHTNLLDATHRYFDFIEER